MKASDRSSLWLKDFYFETHGRSWLSRSIGGKSDRDGQIGYLILAVERHFAPSTRLKVFA